MKNESFQIVIEKIWKYRWKIITTEKIRDIIEQIMWESYSTNRMYKTILRVDDISLILKKTSIS